MIESPRIAITDQDAATLGILARQLGDVFAVQTACSGAQALTLAQASPPPELFLIELRLPDMDGYALCRALQTLTPGRPIPVMFLTAYDSEAEELAGFAAGAVDYVTKPVRPALLIARIRSQIELTRARARLAASNQALQEAGRFREEVDRILRHDLKGPLTGIIGIPQYLLETSEILGEEEREMLQALERAGSSMLTMINHSLDIFRIEQGVYRYQPAAVELLGVLRVAIADCADNLAEGRSVALLVGERLVHPDDRLLIAGEALLTRSLFGNLVRNALEASPHGGVVSIRVDPGADATVTVRVRNRGEVPAGIRDRFFEKFVTAGKAQGTGLGTYAAKLAAETQGGSIGLEADAPGWTCLRVTLPTWPSSLADETAAQSRLTDEAAAQNRTRRPVEESG